MKNLLALIPAIGAILNKIIPDPNEAKRIEAELMKEMLSTDSEFFKAAGSIITAEAKGESWMQRNWRPITMLTFVFIIANNYIFVPYFTWLTDIAFAKGWIETAIVIPALDVPEGLWGLLQIGIGGYIASRGVEKTVQKVQSGGVPMLGGKSSAEVERVSKDVQEMKTEQKELLNQLRTAGNNR